MSSVKRRKKKKSGISCRKLACLQRLMGIEKISSEVFDSEREEYLLDNSEKMFCLLKESSRITFIHTGSVIAHYRKNHYIMWGNFLGVPDGLPTSF